MDEQEQGGDKSGTNWQPLLDKLEKSQKRIRSAITVAVMMLVLLVILLGLWLIRL
jgi:hypothetical protein